MSLFQGNARNATSTGNVRLVSSASVQLTNMDGYLEVVGSSATAILAPVSPYVGQTFTVKDGGFNCSVCPITFQFTIDNTSNPVMSDDGMSRTILWNGTAWRFV